MGDGSTYECSNCGEESGATGHYDFHADMFKCVSKHAAPPTRNTLGELSLARKTKKMTKEEAKKKAQELLTQANELVSAAEKIMDEHRFSLPFLDKDYCPRNLTKDEVESGESEDGEYLYVGNYGEVGYGGYWQGSSDMC